MAAKLHSYKSESIEVSYDVKRCIHAAACVHGLPQVFNPQQRPWVNATAASADEIAAVVMRCPTGALHFTRYDGGAPETAAAENSIVVEANGPLYIQGQITLTTPSGQVTLQDTRLALCRCGASSNKPFCDNSHRQIEFADAGALGHHGLPETSTTTGPTPVQITPTTHGPLLVQGAISLQGSKDEKVYSSRRISLCRCGASTNKPFCDGSHSRVGFQSV